MPRLVTLLRIALLIMFVCMWYSLKYPELPTKMPEPCWRPPGLLNRAANNVITEFNDDFERKFLDSIDDLKSRLRNTRDFQPPLTRVGWEYGISSKYLKKVIHHWLHNYDFEGRMQRMNQFPQFKVNVQGLDIVYHHVRPENPENKPVVPLLLLHGWPSNIYEFTKIYPMLTTPRPDYPFVFEVIAPNLPGFAFSSPATIKGLGTPQIAVVMKNFMKSIGYYSYYVHGSDWGAMIGADMGSLYNEHVRGLHSSLCIVPSFTTYLLLTLGSIAPTLIASEEEYPLMYPLKDHLYRLFDESGYFHFQATKPDVIGILLADSPAGLAAYILDKYSAITHHHKRHLEDGGLTEAYDLDDLLDTLTINWIANSTLSSARIYSEGFNKEWIAIRAPTACVHFPHDVYYMPPCLLKYRFRNLIRSTIMPRGGHFPWLEEPKLFTDDIWASIDIMEVERHKNK
ncbi:juvenile hormone epoxide hydrolase 2-like isoform X2 [Prorops nasuta]|uniref:juvenile hormone epoxide hydrolase 2-like isoform X2 n=1 Tax=Prorops nasuta TaxID=863751 RepID=UPI0034CDE9EC